jgi:hypothetical protein
MPLSAPSSSSFFGVNVLGELPVMMKVSFSLKTSPEFGAQRADRLVDVLELETSSQSPSKSLRSSASGSDVSLNQKRYVFSSCAPLLKYHWRPA